MVRLGPTLLAALAWLSLVGAPQGNPRTIDALLATISRSRLVESWPQRFKTWDECESYAKKHDLALAKVDGKALLLDWSVMGIKRKREVSQAISAIADRVNGFGEIRLADLSGREKEGIAILLSGSGAGPSFESLKDAPGMTVWVQPMASLLVSNGTKSVITEYRPKDEEFLRRKVNPMQLPKANGETPAIGERGAVSENIDESGIQFLWTNADQLKPEACLALIQSSLNRLRDEVRAVDSELENKWRKVLDSTWTESALPPKDGERCSGLSDAMRRDIRSSASFSLGAGNADEFVSSAAVKYVSRSFAISFSVVTETGQNITHTVMVSRTVR